MISFDLTTNKVICMQIGAAGGFALLELLVAIALLALLSIVATPTRSALKDSLNNRNAEMELLYRAFLEALSPVTCFIF